MDASPIFSLLGLTRQHALLYKALIENGPQTVAGLAHKTRMHRPAVYRLVPELEAQGLIRETLRGKRTYFAAEPPEKLKSALEASQDRAQELVAQLEESQAKRGKAPLVVVGTGRKGIASVYDDILHTLKRGDTFYRYSSASKKRPRNAYVPENYEARRDAKRLERYVITNKRTSALKSAKLERYIRIIPAEFDRFEYDITLLVFGDKVAYVDYSTDTAVTIENKAIAQFQKRLFQLLFSKL